MAQARIDINIDENEKQVIISICDNAGGIPESIINQIDQPYFTTKESAVGTGFVITLNKKEEHLGK